MSEGNNPQLGHLGLRLFLLSLSVLFLASLVGIVVVRSRAAEWPPAGAPGLPSGLWLSTALILLSSWTLHQAQRRSAEGGGQGSLAFLLATSALAVAFLVNQAVNWALLWPMFAVNTAALYVFSFVLLTVLHGLHVVGGVVSLGVAVLKARKQRLTAQGLWYSATYWHFLTVVWVVIFVFLKVLF